MKTLVIHPADPTTDFLKVIYEKMVGATIITDPFISKSKIRQLIKEHDHIVMMGHGSFYGLIADQRTKRFIIDPTMVQLLREKDEVTCIWCNADQFVKNYELAGLHTGMIISETLEASMYGVECTPEQIEESNLLFAKAMTGLDWDKAIREYITNNSNPVIEFNRQRIYHI